ncbi:MAG: maleylpyruvate isomerase N-terminal domain-containing protein [Acidimicrobiales bacterium]
MGVAYAGCRSRIGALAGRLDETQAAATVPTCRAWSVHDVVAHVTGVVDDALAGRLEQVTELVCCHNDLAGTDVDGDVLALVAAEVGPDRCHHSSTIPRKRVRPVGDLTGPRLGPGHNEKCRHPGWLTLPLCGGRHLRPPVP